MNGRVSGAALLTGVASGGGGRAVDSPQGPHGAERWDGWRRHDAECRRAVAEDHEHAAGGERTEDRAEGVQHALHTKALPGCGDAGVGGDEGVAWPVLAAFAESVEDPEPTDDADGGSERHQRSRHERHCVGDSRETARRAAPIETSGADEPGDGNPDCERAFDRSQAGSRRRKSDHDEGGHQRVDHFLGHAAEKRRPAQEHNIVRSGSGLIAASPGRAISHTRCLVRCVR